MSYSRWGVDDSSVYTFYNTGGYYECCGCNLNEDSFTCKTAKELIAHLEKHREKGDTVPQYAFDRLDFDMRERSRRYTDHYPERRSSE